MRKFTGVTMTNNWTRVIIWGLAFSQRGGTKFDKLSWPLPGGGLSWLSSAAVSCKVSLACLCLSFTMHFFFIIPLVSYACRAIRQFCKEFFVSRQKSETIVRSWNNEKYDIFTWNFYEQYNLYTWYVCKVSH